MPGKLFLYSVSVPKNEPGETCEPRRSEMYVIRRRALRSHEPTRTRRGNFFFSPSPKFALPDCGRELKEPTPPDFPRSPFRET